MQLINHILSSRIAFIRCSSDYRFSAILFSCFSDWFDGILADLVDHLRSSKLPGSVKIFENISLDFLRTIPLFWTSFVIPVCILPDNMMISFVVVWDDGALFVLVSAVFPCVLLVLVSCAFASDTILPINTSDNGSEFSILELFGSMASCSVCLCLCLCLSVCLSVSASVSDSVSVSVSVSLSLCLSLSVCLSLLLFFLALVSMRHNTLSLPS